MIADIVISALLVIGGIFGLVGSFGLLKLPDPMTRLHAPTKATTVGVGSVLIASMTYFLLKDSHLSWHELLISIFLFLTSPITANFIAKAYLHRTARPQDVPDTGTRRDWATYDAAPEPAEPVLPRPGDPI